MSNSDKKLDAQQLFFKLIKDRLPVHLVLVDKIAELLNMSTDSAYRRIRGEKIMSLDEVVTLAEHFGVSLDNLIKPSGSEIISISFRTLDEKKFTFEQYLKSQVFYMDLIIQAEKKELIYAAKDLPVFYYYNFDELGWFKHYVWKKAIMGLESYQDKKFQIKEMEKANLEIGRQALIRYCQVPGIELWNNETLNSTIRQIDYYFEMGCFEDKETPLLLLEQVKRLLIHIEDQANRGIKYVFGFPNKVENAEFKLFNNEVVMCDNSIMAITDNTKTAFLTHNTLNFMTITEREYCESMFLWFQNLMKRSTLISSVSEKDRTKFFSGMKDKVDKLRQKIENYVLD